MKDFMNMFTQEEMDKALIVRKEELFATDLNYELGVLVGDNLVVDLPTLSTDWIHSGHVIELSDEDGNYIETNEERYSFQQISFDELKEARNVIAKKYLPKSYRYATSAINITDMEQFKKGLSSAIWDCDYSWYSPKVEDITVSYGDSYLYLTIELKLSLD